MTQPQSPAPRRANNIALIAGVVLLLVAIAAGVYFAFFAGPSTPEMTQVGDKPLVGETAGAPNDLAAYLDRTLTAEQKSLISYRVEGNSMLDVVAKSPDGSEGFKAKQIEFKALDTAHEEPQFVDARITGMEITVPADRLPGGVGPVKGSMVYAYSYDETAHTLEVPAIRMDLEGLATIGFTASFTDVTLFSGNPEKALDGLAGGKIKALTFQLKDQALLKAMLEETAKSQGTDLATMKTQGIAMLSILETQVTGSIEKQALAAARTILSKDGNVTLTITANPAEPFPFAQFMLIGQSGGGLPDLTALEPLNLTITAE